MNIGNSATWLLDQAGNPILPPGYVATLDEVVSPSVTLPSGMRSLPVLVGHFGSHPVDLNATQPRYVGFGCIDTDAMPLLTFRMQIGPTVAYWLANPADPQIWKLLDAWDAAGKIALSAHFNGSGPLLVWEFSITPALNALRVWTRHAGDHATAYFISRAGHAILDGLLPRIATSDIASVQKLEHVLGCIVCTPEMGAVRINVVHDGVTLH
jgi:hypothetical protein